jgi:hypothetical protein
MKGWKDANNEKFEVLRSTLVSRLVIHQARTESTQDEMKVEMDIGQENLEAAIHSIWPELDEIIQHRMEDVLQGLCKELTVKIDETQVDLQPIRTSVDMWTKRLLETTTDTREHLHKDPTTGSRTESNVSLMTKRLKRRFGSG